MANKRKQDWAAYLYLMPVVVILVIFHVLPIFYSLAVSFYEWDLIGAPEFVGVHNYQRLFDDPMFYKSLMNTLYYAALSVPLSIISSLAIALLLNNPISAIGLYRTVYFIPVITSINAVAIVWNFIYHPDFGLLNKILDIFSINAQTWLQDPFWAMPCIIFMSVWKGLGYNVIIFLAGLQNIPKHLYEAARIDGASRWQQFRHITWPLLSPTTFFIFTISVIGSFQVFSQVYMMTPRGGPLKSTMVVVYYLYRKAFEQFEFGYALSMAFVLFMIIFACTLFNKLYLEKKVHYS
ncbi:MAG: sugar ABC transporter permease [Candidatus Riflebacteria bacterium HGW-Riflebacteria-1]|jgi:multiple sugar transport system permease protein|nr:MAG: sugar ABC transporter permease [Candidatus Riflebacteria bacterium HGW-Riflebacteria-1]